jgi:hypothetical protein
MLDDDTTCNPTDNRPFQEILDARLSRRTLMVGSLAGAAVAFVGMPTIAEAGTVTHRRRELTSFTSIPLQSGPTPTIAPEYRFAPLIPWREKLDGSGHSYALETLTSAQQERSIGIGHDGMWYSGDNRRGLLCVNHEFGDNSHVLGVDAPTSLEQVRISQAAHGVSVVKVERRSSGWKMRTSSLNRRIHGNTPVAFSGPAAKSGLLATPAGNRPAGTLNNCANGHTPWGTYLTCEENFNGYFGATGAWTPTAMQSRYGLSAGGFGYGWHEFDERFDLSNPDYVNEENRFGWVVEIDPENRRARPVKRTALGRVKHEGAAVTVGRGGRVVVYMGDDERFDYIYKFVSSGNWKSMIKRGKSPLDHGTLYVARFDEDGTGDWLELSPSNPKLAGWSLDEILVYTRAAADAVGATPMDRPEWTSVGRKGEVYCTLTNNTNRTTADAANPMAPNPDGHIIRWVDSDHHVGRHFKWDIFAISKDVMDAGGQMFGSPDGLWADPDGRVFVQTDGSQPGGNNDQMLVAGDDGESFRRLFTGVTGCEVTGIAVTPDRRTMFVNIQHPGGGDPALTNWPAPYTGAGGPVPRDSTVVITRADGGIIGT